MADSQTGHWWWSSWLSRHTGHASRGIGRRGFGDKSILAAAGTAEGAGVAIGRKEEEPAGGSPVVEADSIPAVEGDNAANTVAAENFAAANTAVVEQVVAAGDTEEDSRIAAATAEEDSRDPGEEAVARRDSSLQNL